MDHHHLPLKKPKLEDQPNPIPVDDETNGHSREEDDHDDESASAEEQEEALLALIAHRTHEVEHNKQRVSYYKTQLETSERRLRESQSQFACLRSRRSAAKATAAAAVASNGTGSVPSPSPSRRQAPSRPQLIISPVNPKNPTPPPRPVSGKPSPSTAEKPKREASTRPSPSPPTEKKKAKRTIEQKEHQDLIPSIRGSSSPCTIRIQSSTHISSQHKRKLRSLVLNPVNDQMFITSALDGLVNLWQVQSKGHSASLLSTTDCVSPKQRRWPEDITWHPDGDSLFAVYSADGGDSQISMLNLNLSGDGADGGC